MIDAAHGLNAGNGADFLKRLLIEGTSMPGTSLLCTLNSNHHGKYIVRIKSRVHILQRHKSTNHQPGAGKQDDRKSKFRTHQQAA